MCRGQGGLTLVDSVLQAKRDTAERLMESVTRLSALAREAAEVAAAQKIKAQVRAPCNPTRAVWCRVSGVW